MRTGAGEPTVLELVRGNATLRGIALGTGPPVLLLHPGGEDRRAWSEVAPTLALRGFRAVAFDLRGHGESDAADSGSLATLAADVVAMIEGLAEPPVVVGSSLGGLAAILALGVGAEPPVAGLVLVDVVPDPPVERVRTYLRRASPELVDSPIFEDAAGRSAELRTAVAGLRLPMLLVRGGRRSPLCDEDVERFLLDAPHCRVEAVNGSGHLVARDAPEELAQLIIDELKRPSVEARRREIERRRP